MGWAKLDDGLHDHPKFLQISLAAAGLWLYGRTWTARHGSPVIPPSFVKQRGGPRWRRLANELVGAGLWVESESGWSIHDDEVYQLVRPSRQQISEVRAVAGRLGAQARWHGKR